MSISRLKKIFLTKDGASSSSKLLFDHILRDTSARILQQRYREKLTKKSWYRTHKRSQYKYEETLRGPLTLKFLQEPADDTYLTHVEKITAGQWLQLNFRDPEFERNIYKALRLNQINTDQLALALLLHKAQIEFKNDRETSISPIKQYSFLDPTGPYQPSTIKYFFYDNLKKFRQALDALPESDRCYFTVNFSRIREVAFLYDTLSSPRLRYSPLQYINKQTHLTPERKKELHDFINQLSIPAEAENAATQLKNFLQENEPDLADFLNWKHDGVLHQSYNECYKDRSSSLFLIKILEVGEQNPSFVISPDYDESNPNSPLFAFVIPTIPALSALQHAAHGEDTTLPYFVAGCIPTRLIGDLDEHPELFESKQQSRPIELVHPDLVRNAKPHGASCHDFLLTWHDLFHAWRNGACMFKPFIRHLRHVLAEKGFDMSKNIYELVDLDMSSHVYRYYKAINYFHQDVFNITLINLMLKKANPDFFNKPNALDDHLLIFIDMIINKTQWKELLKINYISFLEEHLISIHFPQEEIPGCKMVIHTHLELSKIVIDHPGKSKEFYIIAYRLRQFPEAVTLCQSIEEKNAWHTLFRWARNSGLYFRLSDKQNSRVETMQPDILLNNLKMFSGNYSQEFQQKHIMFDKLLSEWEKAPTEANKDHLKLHCHELTKLIKNLKLTHYYDEELFTKTEYLLNVANANLDLTDTSEEIDKNLLFFDKQTEETIACFRPSAALSYFHTAFIKDTDLLKLKHLETEQYADKIFTELKLDALDVESKPSPPITHEEHIQHAYKHLKQKFSNAAIFIESMLQYVKLKYEEAIQQAKYFQILKLIQSIITSPFNCNWWNKNTGFFARTTIRTSGTILTISKRAKKILSHLTHIEDLTLDHQEIYKKCIVPLLEENILKHQSELKKLALFSAKNKSDLEFLYLGMLELDTLNLSDLPVRDPESVVTLGIKRLEASYPKEPSTKLFIKTSY